jgi:hypothetical protein
LRQAANHDPKALRAVMPRSRSDGKSRGMSGRDLQKSEIGGARAATAGERPSLREVAQDIGNQRPDFFGL